MMPNTCPAVVVFHTIWGPRSILHHFLRTSFSVQNLQNIDDKGVVAFCATTRFQNQQHVGDG